MPHEDESLDFYERCADARERARAAHGTVSRTHSDAAGPPHRRPDVARDRPSFAVGDVCRGLDTEEILITRIDRDFVHWLCRASHGRMLKAHFLNFFTPIS